MQVKARSGRRTPARLVSLLLLGALLILLTLDHLGIRSQPEPVAQQLGKPPPAWRAVAGREQPLPAMPPIVPVIDARMKARLRALYLAGRARGNSPDVFAKVGDSITRLQFFLNAIGCGQEKLGTHSELAPTIDYFRRVTLPPSPIRLWCSASNSFSRVSLSADFGWTVDTVLHPFSPPHPECPPPYDTPLRCELQQIRPGMALVMLGTNDLSAFDDPARYRRNLTTLLGQIEQAGVVPIVSTLPPRLDDLTYYAPVQVYNRIIVEVAGARRVPVVNYWLAMMGPRMVYHGLSFDGIHPNWYGNCLPPIGCASADFTDEGLRYGFNQRNFTALETFAKIKAIVFDDSPPDSPSK